MIRKNKITRHGAPPAPIHITLLVLLCVRCVAFPAVEAAVTAKAEARVAALLARIEALNVQNAVVRDAKGEVSSLVLDKDLATDANLEDIRGLVSLRELTLQGIPSQGDLTGRGIACLRGLTNLVSLTVACKRELERGTFEEVCKLGQLRTLRLVGACAPQSEYRGIIALQALTELRISYCPNFDDDDVPLLTRLPALKTLVLEWNGVSQQSTNVLAHLGLTNMVLHVKKGN
jgi:hypothetical protein